MQLILENGISKRGAQMGRTDLLPKDKNAPILVERKKD